ncbi:MAG: strictosidine synthase family protein [Planctomycetia bacterium]|nr:strictosidine synthase family protein [Planctomycetia bacterium]
MSDTQADEASNRPDATEAPDDPKASRLKQLGYALATIVLIVLAYLFLWPSPIDPVAYQPPPAPPLAGALAPNDRLQSAEIIAAGAVDGPEDVEVDAQGNIFTGTADGRIVRVDLEGTATTFATTGGRPIGIAFAPDGNLIVADGFKGLLSIDPAGAITTLVTKADGVDLGFPDDLDIARDGTIYFSDASSRFGPGEYLYDMLEARPHGRLLRYDPRTLETKVLLPELYFANGIALSQNEDFVLVNETYRFRITRYWLTGEKAGTSDTFVDNLPGYPDNISSNRQGTFWLALFTVRNETGDWLAPRPMLKRTLAKLPGFLWPQPQPYAFVVKLDEQGNIVDSFQDPTGKHLREITSAQERNGYLYLGSLRNDRIGKYKLP